MRSKLDWSYLAVLTALVALIVAAAVPRTAFCTFLDDLIEDGPHDLA